jgi:ribosomal protein S18 acetylase RimI-like enzyme
MELIIEVNDSNIITNILNKAFFTVAQELHFTKENASTFPAFIHADRIEKSLKNGLRMFGYVIDEQIIACAGFSHYKDETYFIERLATLPEYRHRGIGKKMMDFVEIQIKNIGGKNIEIHVVDKNTPLREWYKQLHYKEIRIDEIPSLPFYSCVMNKTIL